ncbi:TRAP-type C4-dicarboxylate transport system, small permease component [Tistlia consotensis]|uniref:TRAP transporter small permease protein n=1 Tax=Tistlia consotensis USBA 355 TaxID=560819 RepID=A0A1Y6CLN1_9PROT|nr:TRAP transporter small permease [Tistlia consotensis]SMF76018.1 TRAP-type C4-dicarboxylate transport system, small permease component [Tistlia consotensis USBA 355]SNS11938.1 TRAP-type C4-dicarboxylate transport system, small permease component [Tistlia consotensis]
MTTPPPPSAPSPSAPPPSFSPADESAPERALDRALDLLARCFSLLSGFCLVVLIAIFGWLVFGRYVLNATPTWAEQLGLLLIAVITFFSGAVGVHEQRHLSVDFLRDALPRGPRRLLLVAGDLVMAVFGLLMAVNSWDLVLFKWSTKIPLLDLPEGLRSLPLTICGALLVIFAGSRALRRALGRYPDDEHLFDPLDALQAEAGPLHAPEMPPGLPPGPPGGAAPDRRA